MTYLTGRGLYGKRSRCSACSMEMEQRLFQICNELQMSYITISHRPALIAYHDQMITIGDGQAGFTLKDLGTAGRRQNRQHAQREIEAEEQEAKGAGAAESGLLGDAEQSIKQHQENRSRPYAALQSHSQTELAKAEARAAAKAQATAGGARTTLKRLRCLLSIAMPNGALSEPALFQILACVLCKTGLLVTQNHFVGRMLFYLPPQDLPNFFRVTMCSVLVAIGLAGVGEAGVKWSQRRLMMRMRTRLTKNLLGRFYSKLAFYRMVSVDNAVADPEQRLADDVDAFTESMSMVLTEVVAPTIDVTYFSISLLRYVGPLGLVGLWSYLVGSLLIYKVIIPDYKYFIEREKELQGKFKFVHGRVRMHAESIAFFGGGEREKQICNQRFDRLLALLRVKRVKDTQFGFAEGLLREKLPECMEWATQFFYLRGIGSDGGSAAQYDYWNVGQAVRTAIDSFTEMMKFAEKFTTLSGLVARIAEVDEALVVYETSAVGVEEAHQTAEIEVAAAEVQLSSNDASSLSEWEPVVSMRGCDIVTPTGTCLASNLRLTITPKTPLMVTGPNACGKTSFFRVIGGLWPVRGGKGTSTAILNGGVPDIFLVPQRIYCCPGTLADQVTYPNTVPCTSRDEATTATILRLVGLVGLSYLTERPEGLDTALIWEDTLSLGEQQRLGVARMFFSKPRFGVMDECTSAVSQDVEEALYHEAATLDIATITLSQRLALPEFHVQELRLGSNNPDGWSLHQVGGG